MTCSDCGDPACQNGGLFFRSLCHNDVPTWVEYNNGVLTVRCAECDNEIAQVAVGSGTTAIQWN